MSSVANFKLFKSFKYNLFFNFFSNLDYDWYQHQDISPTMQSVKIVGFHPKFARNPLKGHRKYFQKSSRYFKGGPSYLKSYVDRFSFWWFCAEIQHGESFKKIQLIQPCVPLFITYLFFRRQRPQRWWAAPQQLSSHRQHSQLPGPAQHGRIGLSIGKL